MIGIIGNESFCRPNENYMILYIISFEAGGVFPSRGCGWIDRHQTLEYGKQKYLQKAALRDAGAS